MNTLQTPALRRWHMNEVAPRHRFDSWVAAVNSTLIPVYAERPVAESFPFELTATQLGPIGIVQQRAGGHQCGRRRSELSRSCDRSFNLLMSLDSPYGVSFRGERGMRPDDLTLYYSEYPIDLIFAREFNFMNLSLPESWVRTWIPNPQAFAGRCISAATPWGRALSSFVKLLTPAYVVTAPIASAVLLDQLGALLSLAASPGTAKEAASPKAKRSLQDQIVVLVDERCHEESLSAEQVAHTLAVSVRTVHRALAASGATFGALLIGARVACAARMLQSRSFNRLTIAEIGRRAGFTSASHFSRAVKSRLGYTPVQLRTRPTPTMLTAGSASGDPSDEAES